MNFHLLLVDKKVLPGKVFSNITGSNNFDQLRPQCAEGWRLTKLIPSERCGDIFKLSVIDNRTNIHIRRDSKVTAQYCLEIQNDFTYQASYCKKESPKYKET